VSEPWHTSAGRTWLRRVSWAETVSLAVLLVNLATVHLPAVASAVGPLHGTFYLACIATTLLQPMPAAARRLAAVPGIGGLLALRRADAMMAG